MPNPGAKRDNETAPADTSPGVRMTSRSSAFGGGSSRSSRLGRTSRQRFSGLEQTAMRECDVVGWPVSNL